MLGGCTASVSTFSTVDTARRVRHSACAEGTCARTYTHTHTHATGLGVRYRHAFQIQRIGLGWNRHSEGVVMVSIFRSTPVTTRVVTFKMPATMQRLHGAGARMQWHPTHQGSNGCCQGRMTCIMIAHQQHQHNTIANTCASSISHQSV